MEHINLFAPAIITIVVLLACMWYVARDEKRGEPCDDSGLLDFLDQSGFSVQHLPGGRWGVTDGAQRLVGKPDDNVRDAIRSAVDQMVEDRRG